MLNTVCIAIFLKMDCYMHIFIYLLFLSGVLCCIFNLQTNNIKTIVQITDTTSKTAKIAFAITLTLLPSVSLFWLFSFSVMIRCDDSTVT